MTAQTVVCDSCGKTYNLREELLGKRVKCAGCGNAFVAKPVSQERQTPDAPATPAVVGQEKQPAQADVDEPAPTSVATPQETVEGPTDRQFRLGALIAVPLCILGTILVLVFQDVGVKGLIILLLGPFVVCFGIAGMIDPNIIRAAGKYGSHLPARYKLIAGAVGLVALAISGCLSAWLYFTQLR